MYRVSSSDDLYEEKACPDGKRGSPLNNVTDHADVTRSKVRKRFSKKTKPSNEDTRMPDDDRNDSSHAGNPKPCDDDCNKSDVPQKIEAAGPDADGSVTGGNDVF